MIPDSEAFTPKQRRRAVRGLTFVAAAGAVTYHSALGNYLALFADRLGFTPMLIGVLFLAVQFPAVLQIAAAGYVDRHGGKRVTLLSFFWGPLFLMPMVLAPQIGAWLGPWAAQGSVFVGVIGYALCSMPANAAWMPLLRANLPAGEIAEGIGRMNGIIMGTVVTVTTIFSILLGNAPHIMAFQAIFLVGMFAGLTRGMAFRHVRDMETHPAGPARDLSGEMAALWRDVPFRRLIIFVIINFLAAGIAQPFRPLYLTSLGFSARFAALLTVPLVLGAFGLGSRSWGALADRYGSRGVYVLAGLGTTLGQLLLVAPRGSGPFDGVLAGAGLFIISFFWAGLDAGNLRRLFSIVPRQGQSLYMSVYMVAMTASLSVGSFMGGVIVRAMRLWLPTTTGPSGWGLALDYRVLFLITALGLISALAFSRRMMALEEISASRLLIYLRIRTQRSLMGGTTGGILRRILPEED